MSTSTKPSSPARARLCACDAEPKATAPGFKLWVKKEGVLTFNHDEADWSYQMPVAQLNERLELVLTDKLAAALGGRVVRRPDDGL